MNMKRGMSQVISTVLLISLVVVVGGLVFLWIRGSVLKAEEQASGEKLCSEAQFVIGDFCYEKIIQKNMKTGESKERVYIKFNGRNEIDEPELSGFLVFLDYEGTTLSIQSEPHNELEGYDAKSIITEPVADIEGIREIKVVPKIKKDRNIFICEKQEVFVDGEDLKEC